MVKLKKITTFADENGHVQTTTEEYGPNDSRSKQQLFQSIPFFRFNQHMNQLPLSSSHEVPDDQPTTLFNTPHDPFGRIRPWIDKWKYKFNPFNWKYYHNENNNNNGNENENNNNDWFWKNKDKDENTSHIRWRNPSNNKN